MSSRCFGRVGLTVLVTAVTLGGGAVGCASERDPINRVQANAIPKSFFVGSKLNDSSDDPEFYARSMLIDVPYGESSGGLYTNGINAMSRIKWSIEENNLIGRISFERVAGTDGKGLTPKADPTRDPQKPLAQNDGLVVYNFRVISQFDIRRGYNAATGEEQNLVEENTTDRPWYDRQYIRVDFSKNLVTTSYDFDTLSILGMIEGIKYTPMEFDVRNPDDVNAPVYDFDRGYFDVTNKLFAEPQMVDFFGMKVPGCVLSTLFRGGSAPVGNCNPNELTVRHSFKRVVDTDYEPTDWDGQRFETYGAFVTERDGYARDYGLADKNWKRFISRYNIWERSHSYTDPEKMEGAVTCNFDNDCAMLGGGTGIVHCDTTANKCTLPYQNRTEKPIVWHYSDGSAPEFFDATRDATEEWDVAMRSAVQTAKYAECMSFGNLRGGGSCADTYPAVIDGNFADEEDAVYLVKEVQACRRDALAAAKKDPVAECIHVADEISDQRGYAPGVRAIAKLPEMVILCHSPVDKADPEACGKAGTVARLGDLRFHLVTAVATPQSNSPWGIMTDANDPLTGEHVAASINVWTHNHDTFARQLVDTFRYIGGELKTEDITDGTYVDKWVDAARASSGVGFAPVIDTDEVDKRVSSIAGISVERLRAIEKKQAQRQPMRGTISEATRSPLEKALLANLKTVAQTKESFDAPSSWGPIYDARVAQLRGTPGEAALVTPAMQELGKAAMGLPLASGGDSVLAASSVLQGLNPRLVRTLEQQFQNAVAARGGCVMEAEALAPLGYAALADVLQAKFGRFDATQDDVTQSLRADRMQSWLARRAHYSVISHEMGHSFGLRHNFVSSSDSWNYRPQYWALRTNGKKVTDECPTDGSAADNGANCVGPRWLDRVTANEQKNLIAMWGQSSTMDYAGEPTQDLLGLGAYDFGAVRMFYGDVTTVYKDARFKKSANVGKIAQDHQNDFGGLLGFRYGSFSDPIHYSHLDKTVNLIESCAAADPDAFRPANWNEEKDGVWNALVDGHIVTNEAGRPTRCTQPKVDYVQWSQLSSTADKTHSVDKSSRVRVPHAFASDSWVDLGNVAVYRHDNGADLYETMHFWQAQQEMNHIFTSYRRGRRDFNLWGSFRRTLTRYHEKMRDAAKSIGLYVNLARDTVVTYNTGGDDPDAFVGEVLKQVAVEAAISSSIAFDQFAHVFARPQPGEHGSVGDEDPGNGVTIARSWDSVGFGTKGTAPMLSVANGVTGGFGAITLGGRPIENALDRTKGRDYSTWYPLNVGSYYEKAYTAYLMTESADNFVSSSRDDYVDPRFRSVSLADVFPDGFRRWLANNLTNDEQIKGVYAMATGGNTLGPPALDDAGYAVLGTTQWWPKEGVETCLPKQDRIFCQDPFTPGTPAGAGGTVVDSQVGFEQQKFAIIFSLLYLPENARTNWLDQIRIYDVSTDGNPGFDNRIEFHDPDGKVYAAQTFGTEVLYGKTVQKGIAARVLEYANSLLEKGVTTEPVMLGERQIGVKAKLTDAGAVEYKNGDTVVPSCAQSKYCQQMKDYTAIPKLMFEIEAQLGVNRFGGWLRGVYQ